jgi:2-oxoglutarate ferredoxin oxidoreductase subunit beta
MNRKIAKYFRADRMPFIWCPGCGNGSVLAALAEAFEKLSIDRDKTVIVSGIGCSSRAPLYMDFDTLHTTHGRAITFASGVKMARPEFNVFVITGDGDCSAIGGNHLIHAARRNIDLTVLCMNNSVYGMTNGQFSPTTPYGALTATTPFGNAERSFDLCKLVQAAGATYVARATTYHLRMLPGMIMSAVNNKGFSFIDVITQCPTYYGRKNKIATPVDMLKWMRDNSVNLRNAENRKPEELAGKFILGEFYNTPAPEFTAEYDRLAALKKRKT